MTAVLSLTSCSKSHSLGRLGESGNQSKWKKICFSFRQLASFETIHIAITDVGCGRCFLRFITTLHLVAVRPSKPSTFTTIIISWRPGHNNHQTLSLSWYRDDQVVQTCNPFLASGREWSRNRADAGWPQATITRWNRWIVFFAFKRSDLVSFPNLHAHPRTQPLGPLCLWQYICPIIYQVCRHSYMEVLHSVPRWKSWQRTGGWWSWKSNDTRTFSDRGGVQSACQRCLSCRLWPWQPRQHGLKVASCGHHQHHWSLIEILPKNSVDWLMLMSII